MFSICQRDSTPSIADSRYTLCFFFYKNLFYKNVKAEINQNFKNEAESRLRTFLLGESVYKIKVTNVNYVGHVLYNIENGDTHLGLS